MEQRAVAAVVRLSRLPLPDRNCLRRSLTLYRELSHWGARPNLVVGFRRTDGRLVGHAWVVSDGQVVADDERDVAQFLETCRFGERGAIREPH
jgi:Transglutaminase-like superfamily